MTNNEMNPGFKENGDENGYQTGEVGQYTVSTGGATGEPPVLLSIGPYDPAGEQIHYPAKGTKWRKPVRRAVAAIALCLALALASGFAGAKITELRLAPSQSSNGSVLAYDPPAGTFGNGNDYDYNTSGGDFNIDKSSDSADSNSANSSSANSSSDSADSSSASISNSDSSSASISDSDSANSVNPLGRVNPGGDSLSLTELFAGANPAVVAISTETTGRNVFGRDVTLPAAGSGFIISADGYIVTNNHVIEYATTISVLLHDGTKHPAVLVGRDPETDLAVLKIEADGLSYLTWGASDALQVGEQVAAIGNPLGEFANSMTVGYISALDREINIDGTPRNMLQTDAAVNSGNSGGPLLNLQGQVIGIVTAKSSGMDVEGLGFAIPSSVAANIADLLIKDGYVKGRAVLGVMVGSRQDDGRTSVYIESVNDGSAAEKAGVQAGDIILSANDANVSTIEELKGIISGMSPGDKLRLRIRRDNEEMSLTAILDESKPSEMPAAKPSDNRSGNRSDNPYDNPYDNQFPGFPDGDARLPYGPWGSFPDIGGTPEDGN